MAGDDHFPKAAGLQFIQIGLTGRGIFYLSHAEGVRGYSKVTFWASKDTTAWKSDVTVYVVSTKKVDGYGSILKADTLTNVCGGQLTVSDMSTLAPKCDVVSSFFIYRTNGPNVPLTSLEQSVKLLQRLHSKAPPGVPTRICSCTSQV